MIGDCNDNCKNTQSKSKNKKRIDNDSRYDINRRLNTVIDLYVPLTICAFIALFVEEYLNPFEDVYSLATIFMYNDKKSLANARANQYSGSLKSIPSLTKMIIITFCFLGIIIVMTSLIVFLYVKGYKKWIDYFFYGQIFFSFVVTETRIIAAGLVFFEIPLNHWIITLISVIFSLIGVFSIQGYGPQKLRQFFHIILGANISLLFVNMFPEWIIWCILIIISVWDLVAVLWNKGPLNILVNTANNRNEEIFNALVYSCIAYSENAKNDVKENKEVTRSNEDGNRNVIRNEKIEVDECSEEENNRNAKLGMGDFVFYTLLLLHVSKYNNPISLVNCFTAILSGLTMTIFILVYFKRALPALPISIFSSTIFFFGTYYLGSPFYEELYNNNIIF